jgi:tetratricopeptide (TPR) repeat protein
MSDLQEAQRLYDQGLDEYRAGEYDIALEALQQAQEIYGKAGEQASESETLNDQGVVYIQQEMWEEAKQVLDEALAIRTSLEDRSGQALTLGNMGMMYERQGNRDEAIAAYEQALEIFGELGEKGNVKAISRQLSNVKIKNRRFLSAVDDYEVGLEADESLSAGQKLARQAIQWMTKMGIGPQPEEDTEDEIDITPGS